MGDDKENVPRDSKLSEYSIYDNDEERRKVRAEYRHLNQISEGKVKNYRLLLLYN